MQVHAVSCEASFHGNGVRPLRTRAYAWMTTFRGQPYLPQDRCLNVHFGRRRESPHTSTAPSSPTSAAASHRHDELHLANRKGKGGPRPQLVDHPIGASQ